MRKKKNRQDTRIYMNLLNLGVNLPTENREYVPMNSNGIYICMYTCRYIWSRGRRSHLFIIPIFSRLDLFQHSYAGMFHTVPGCICLHTNSQLPYAVCDNHLLQPPFEFFLPLSPAEVKIWTKTTSAGK